MITVGNEVGLSKVGEIHRSFDAVLVKITNLYSRKHMKIMKDCEIINASHGRNYHSQSQTTWAHPTPNHYFPSLPISWQDTVLFAYALSSGKCGRESPCPKPAKCPNLNPVS